MMNIIYLLLFILNSFACYLIWIPIVLVVSIICAILIPEVVDNLQTSILKQQLLITSTDSPLFSMFSNSSVEASFYMFNITNKQAILDGAPVEVEEIGPFIYSFIQEKSNFVWNEDEDTLDYSLWSNIVFNATATSIATKGKYNSTDIQLTTINFIFFGMLTQFDSLLWYPLTLSLGFNTDMERMFVEKSMNEIIQGYTLDAHVPGIGNIPITFQGLNPILPRNQSIEYTKKSRIIVGESNITNMFQFVQWEGSSQTQIQCPWGQISNVFYCPGNAVCCSKNQEDPNAAVANWDTTIVPNVWDSDANRVQGTDGNQFHPNIKTSDKLTLFSDTAHRAMLLENVNDEQTVVEGIKLLRFSPTNDFFQNSKVIPSNSRYFRFGPNGLVNMTNVFGIGLFASLPHFLYGDDILFEKVKGLNPVESEHRIIVDIEPVTGKSLQGQTTNQINIEIYKTTNHLITNYFPKLMDGKIYVPVMWIKDVARIPKDDVSKFDFIPIVKGVKDCAFYGGISIAIICLVSLTYIIYRRRLISTDALTIVK